MYNSTMAHLGHHTAEMFETGDNYKNNPRGITLGINLTWTINYFIPYIKEGFGPKRGICMGRN